MENLLKLKMTFPTNSDRVKEGKKLSFYLIGLFSFFKLYPKIKNETHFERNLDLHIQHQNLIHSASNIILSYTKVK